MNRKTLIAAALVVVAVVAAARTFGPAGAADKEAKAPYVHVVVFHLKPDAPKGAVAEMIADAHGLLAKISSVREVRAGRPAEMSTPDFSKKDYQLGLLVLLDNYDGLKTYLDHPLHLEYVKRHLKHVDEKKLLVYDFVNQTK